MGGALVVSGLLHSLLGVVVLLALREPSAEMQTPEPIPIEIVLLDAEEIQAVPPTEVERKPETRQEPEEDTLAALDELKTSPEQPFEKLGRPPEILSESPASNSLVFAPQSGRVPSLAEPEAAPPEIFESDLERDTVVARPADSAGPERISEMAAFDARPEGRRTGETKRESKAAAVPPAEESPNVAHVSLEPDKSDSPRDLVLRVQAKLKAAGFDPGPLDGEMGPQTRAAISALFVGDPQLLDLGPLALLDMPQNGDEAVGRPRPPSGESVIESFPFRASAPSAGQSGNNDAGAAQIGEPRIAKGLPGGFAESLPQECRGTPAPVSLSSGAAMPPDPFAPGYFEYFLAQDAQNGGAHARAVKIYGKAIDSGALSDEYLAFAYNNRGAALKKTGRAEHAIADYARALALRPGYAPAYYNRGLARQDLGRNEEAVADYSAAIRFDPRHAHAYHNRGIAHEALGKPERALADLNRAIEIAPCLDYAYFNRGRLLEAMGELQRARKDFETAYALKPHSPLYSQRPSELSGAK